MCKQFFRLSKQRHVAYLPHPGTPRDSLKLMLLTSVGKSTENRQNNKEIG